ncbi:MAG TPA: hypothetical protein VM638_01285, partial [Actinomycetota bacterium]|nr:hypothetical protein [Actinomycetota bacterium]
MYRRYREDPASVDEAWAEFFEGYRPRGAAPPEPQPAPTRTQAPTAPAPDAA